MKQYNMDDTLRAWKTSCGVAHNSIMRIVANVEDVFFLRGGGCSTGCSAVPSCENQIKTSRKSLKKMNKSEKCLQRFRVSPTQLRDGHVFVLI
jgi:hypothetical protein